MPTATELPSTVATSTSSTTTSATASMMLSTDGISVEVHTSAVTHTTPTTRSTAHDSQESSTRSMVSTNQLMSYQTPPPLVLS